MAGLIEIAAVEPLLACPRCRSPVVRDADALRCTSPRCDLSAEGSFPIVDRWPALVDFANSIIRREQLTSPSAAAQRWSIDRLPARLRVLWKPRNLVAVRNVETLLSRLPRTSAVILVVGGATAGNGVEAIYTEARARIVAFDIHPSPLTQFIADAHGIPLAASSVDAVIVQAVLEHVLDPDQVVREIHRVLRPHGLVYAETPFLQQVHAGPYDFSRYTSSGHRYLFRAFEEVSAGPVAGPGAQLLTSLDHLVRGLLRSELAGKITRALFFWLRSLDRLIPDEFAMDNASAYYVLGHRADSALSAHEIVDYYRGAQRAR